MEIIAKIAGVRQRVRAKIVEEKTPLGRITYLEIERALPISELQRIADEQSMPVKCKEKKIFPKGKSIFDFVDN
jgi:hypothetical protein